MKLEDYGWIMGWYMYGEWHTRPLTEMAWARVRRDQLHEVFLLKHATIKVRWTKLAGASAWRQFDLHSKHSSIVESPSWEHLQYLLPHLDVPGDPKEPPR